MAVERGIDISDAEELKAAVEPFLQGLDLAPDSIRTYKEALKTFFSWLGPRVPDTALLLEYKNWLKERRTANTISTYIVALRRFLRYCVAQGLLSEDPTRELRGVRRPRGHLRHDLTREEIRALLSVIDRTTELGKRDFAIINLMVRNGLRIVEIQRANVGDLEERQGRKILRVLGKGREERDEFVVLSRPAEEALLDYLKTRGNPRKDEPLFVGVGGRNRGKRLTRRTIRRRVTYYMIKAGIKRERVSPHSLRHSFVTLAIEGGATLEQAQIAARHRSILTTRIYFHEHDRLENPIEDKIEI